MTAKPNRSSRKSSGTSGKRSGSAKSAKKPVTIDLEPEKVVTSGEADKKGGAKTTPTSASSSKQSSAKPKETPKPSGSVPKSGGSGTRLGRNATPADPSSGRSGDLFGKLAAGVIGGLIVLGGGGILQYLGYLPTPGTQTAGLVTSETLKSSTTDLNSKIAALEAKLAEAASAESLDKAAVDAAIEAQLAELPGAGKDIVARGDLDTQLSATTTKIDELQARLDKTTSALDSVQSSISSGEAGDAAALSALSTRMESVSGELSGLRDNVSKLSGGITADQITSMGTMLAALQGKTSKVDERLAAIDARIGALPEKVADAQELTSVGSELASIKTAVESVQSDLGNQKDALSGVQDKLANGADKKAAQALAAAALKSDIDRGLPFAESLSVLKSVAGDSVDVSGLESYAAKGIPSEALLVDGFDAVNDAVMKATTDVKEESALTRLVAGAKSFVKVRSVAPVEGDTPAAILSRVGAAVTSGDLANAATEWGTLPDTGKAVSKQWHDDLQARINANALMANTVQSFMSSSGAGN